MHGKALKQSLEIQWKDITPKRRGSWIYLFFPSMQSPDRVVWVQALTGEIALCSWAKHFTLTVLLSTQTYKWVRPGKFNARGNSAMDSHPIQGGGVEILLEYSRFMLLTLG